MGAGNDPGLADPHAREMSFGTTDEDSNGARTIQKGSSCVVATVTLRARNRFPQLFGHHLPGFREYRRGPKTRDAGASRARGTRFDSAFESWERHG